MMTYSLFAEKDKANTVFDNPNNTAPVAVASTYTPEAGVNVPEAQVVIP